jgi:N-acetyl-1-D-myo-inositol-2-amino-2-deoxy-alpha-D-glucopyranoside deacetylase
MPKEPLTLMAVHAHPDDESIGTGGILAKYSGEGIHTALVHCTRGELGDIQDPSFVPPEPGMALEDIRMLELDNALSVLGVQTSYYLGYRDSGMAGNPNNDNPASFAQVNTEEASRRLANIIRQVKPQVIVTYDEKGVYGHPDHIMTNVITIKAFFMAGDADIRTHDGDSPPPWQPAKLYYIAIPLERLQRLSSIRNERQPDRRQTSTIVGTPESDITTVIDVSDVLDLKFKAIFCHKSQIGQGHYFRHLPEDLVRRMFGHEHFVCVHGRQPSPEKETDLFAGLR